MNDISNNPELIAFIVFFALNIAWMSKMFVVDASVRTQRIVGVIMFMVFAIPLGYFMNKWAVLGFAIPLLLAEIGLHIHMRAYEQRLKAEDAYFRAAGYLAGSGIKL